MRFHTQNHQHYCGIDLHARSMYVCILDHDGNALVHRNLPAFGKKIARKGTANLSGSRPVFGF